LYDNTRYLTRRADYNHFVNTVNFYPMRTPHFILFALISLATVKVGHASLIQTGFIFEEFRTYTGTLEHSADKSELYIVTDQERVPLAFTYDKIEDIDISDWGEVIVSGYYSRFHSVLQVEEIIPIHVTFS